MEQRPIIKFDFPIDDRVHDILAGAGGRPHSDPTGWVMPSASEAAAAQSQLAETGVEFEVFFEMQPAPGDPTDDLAAYLSLADLGDTDAEAGALLLACDEESLATVASRSLVELIGPATGGLQWKDFPGREGCLVLEAPPELPDPVVVPRVMYRAQGATDEWLVQSDGRELLTAANVAAVRAAGIARAARCKVDDEVLAWSRPPIFSGPVLALLRDVEVAGIGGPPTFLGWLTDS